MPDDRATCTQPSSGGCPRCEQLGPPLSGGRRLFLWAPVGHTAGKLLTRLTERQVQHDWRAPAACIAVDLSSCVGGAGALLPVLASDLSSEEQSATRALVIDHDGDPLLEDLKSIASLEHHAGVSRADWLIALLGEDRLVSHFQPIRDVASGALFAHEALLRGIDPAGASIPAGRLIEAARSADLIFQLDLAARRSAVRCFARTTAAGDGRLFINFTPTSIYDPASCLRTTFATINELGLRPDQIVFEVVESEHIRDSGHLVGVLAHYRKEGFLVALDDLGSGFSSLNLLHRLRPDFVKLDMELVQGVHDDPYKAVLAAKLLEAAKAIGVRTICEGLETEADLDWVRRHGTDYVQGYLLGRPAPQPATH